MDHDPEQRIAELERQLAEHRRIASAGDLRARPADPNPNLGSQGFSPMPTFPGQVNAGQQAGFAPVGWQYPAQTPQLGSWRTPGAGSGMGRGGRSIAAMLVMGLFGINFLVGGLVGLGASLYEFYGYQVGTPTTATVDHCVRSGKSSSTCYGTWSVGGVSQTGKIAGGLPSGSGVGRSLDVHVSGGKAYTADSVGGRFYVVIGVGILGVGLGVALLRGAWRNRR